MSNFYCHPGKAGGLPIGFTVVEGHYGLIKLNNQSRLSDAVANKLLESLPGTGAVTSAELERRLLVLSDLPGVYAKSVLTPGEKLGTTDLNVQLSESHRTGGKLDFDNHGNKYTGAHRIGASVFLNEPTGLGDLATARVLTAGDGLSYGQATYQAQVGWAAVGLSYAAMTYRLSGDFSSIQSSGTAHVQSFFLGYPLIRSREKNLSIQWSSDRKEFSDLTALGSMGTRADKDTRLASVTLRGDFRDSSGQASNDYAATWSHGEINLYEPTARNLDSMSAQSQGGFDKVTFGFARLQAVSKATQLYAGINGQWASKNLDASEKFSLGGAGSVRAFPSGEAAGDEGLVLTVESRTNLPSPTEQLPGKLRLLAFLDAGVVNTNKALWGADTGVNQRSLSGAGLGLIFVGADKLVINAYYAFKLGSNVSQSQNDAPGRFWFQINKSF
ncbi:MAG: ShlB/FhaC/HecB family hemolysin secretion/activation protein [Rhodoferax sp.]|uniref:ShlB/FhaC/HecB family hemolysin secretion/activation protein n=1 Tax=Rhodoferax sp. TaxID=50421 RepID=UPI001B4091B2|nr:ShlB/FhaC/HecB family hemolysin secretion/activation protein [Rhodoferax sp.]MBP9737200.1 ShlB/FhaC/HecB family hemolysin secretion/activation protein [Rhodoferax sp.]